MKTYTATEISIIHRTAKAVPDRIYKSETGDVFKGTKERRLEKVISDNKTIIQSQTTSSSDFNSEFLLMGG